MKDAFVLRTRILCACFVLASLFLIARLYFVQIVRGAEYADDATAQYAERNPDTGSRGSIFFTDKNGEFVSAAVMQKGWRIALEPKNIVDPATTYEKLNALTPIDTERFFASAGKKTDPYEEVAYKIPDDVADKIRALKLPGVLLVSDQWRFYPARQLAAQVLGFVGYSGTSTSKVGVYGLEKKWDDTLSYTKSGLYVNPFAEIFTNLQDAVTNDPASREGAVVTSLEPSVQLQLEKTLDAVMQTYTPDLAGGIVMDPHTGEIVAIAGRPAFDPNTYNIEMNPVVFDNSLVQGRYELGSIMKPLTMAAAIDSGAVTPSTTYNDTGCIERSTFKLCNFDLKARGVIPMQQILSQSLNVGATFLADTMGHPTLTRYLKLYGLGEKTGIDLPDEVTGDLSILGVGNGPDVNYATAAFGQGIAVSPIEMTRALSALANAGVLPNPHVVRGVRYESGITRGIDPGEGAQVLSATTTLIVTNMLVKVFDAGLLDGALKMDHYSIAAKTGTAQIPKTGGGYLGGDTYLHSFFGYFPAHDPKFIVFLFAVKPHGQKYASATLAHPFAEIAKYLINYYDIPPDR